MINGKVKGMTLIEMMIVVVIIGIIAAIALPSYQSQVEKTNLADMKKELASVRQQLESQKLTDTNYARGKGDALAAKYQAFLADRSTKINSDLLEKYTVTVLAEAPTGNQVNTYMLASPKRSQYKFIAYMDASGTVFRCPKSAMTAVRNTKPSSCENF